MDDALRRMLAGRKQSIIDNILSTYSSRQLTEPIANGLVGALRELVNLERDYDRLLKEEALEASKRLMKVKSA